MKKRLVYRVFIGLFLLILLGSQSIHPSVAFAESFPTKDKEADSIYLEVGSRHALVYGKLKQMTSLPVVENGTTLVPLRFVSEQLGAKVSWEEETQQITLEKDADTIVLHIGSAQMLVNGNPKKLSLPPRFIDDRTFVPLRAVSEAFGKTVFYENDLIGISDASAALQIGQDAWYKANLLERLAPQEINIRISEAPYTLDATYAGSTSELSIINLFNEGLYRLDESGKPTPALAESLPTVSQDGLTYTIKLRENLVWSDGVPLTAQAFVNSVGRMDAPEANPPFYEVVINLIKHAEITAPDKRTLVIKLNHPYPSFTQQLAMPYFFPMRLDKFRLWSNQPYEYGKEAATVIGAGPFVLQSWTQDGELEFVKNDRYWDAENVQLDKVKLSTIQNTMDGLDLYERNHIDLTNITGDITKIYNNTPDYIEKNDLVNAYIIFQEWKVPAFSNKKIRQALSLAIDKEEMVRNLLPTNKAAYGLIPDGTSDGSGGDFRKTAGAAMEGYNPEKAKQLLQEGLQELGLKEMPSFTLLSDNTNTAKKVVDFIISKWKTILGIDVESKPLAFADRVDNQNARNFEAVVALWGADINDPMAFLEIFKSYDDFNDGSYSNPNFDNLLVKIYAEKDAAKRTQLLVEAEKQLMEDMPIAPLYFRERAFLIKPTLKGVFLPPFGFEWELKWASKSN